MTIEKIRVALTWLDTALTVGKAVVKAGQAIVSALDAGKASVDLIRNGGNQ